MGDLFPVHRRDGHLLQELPAGFHVRERIVGGEHDPVDADHVDHGLIGVERQTPTGIGRAGFLAGELAGQDAAVEVLPQIFLDGPLKAALLRREGVVGTPGHPAQCLEMVTDDHLQRGKPIEDATQNQPDAMDSGVDVPAEARDGQLGRHRRRKALVVGLDHRLRRHRGMQIDRHTQDSAASKTGQKSGWSRSRPSTWPLISPPTKPWSAHGAFQFGRQRRRGAHRRGGKAEEPVGVLGGRGDHGIVGLPGQLDGLRSLDGLDAGNVGEDLHVDAGGIHRRDPTSPRSSMPGGGQPCRPCSRRTVSRAVGVRVGDGRQRVVLLESNDFH